MAILLSGDHIRLRRVSFDAGAREAALTRSKSVGAEVEKSLSFNEL
jgi:hypothetical protein